MNDTTRGAAGAARRGNRAAADDAGRDARGRATQGAVGENRAGAGKIRRQAWLLAGLAVLFYAAYMTWMALRSNGGV